MKHVLKIIVSLSLFSMAFTQEDTTTVKNEELRANTLSFSAFWGAFGLIHANYGKVMDNGKKSISSCWEHLVTRTTTVMLKLMVTLSMELFMEQKVRLELD